MQFFSGPFHSKMRRIIVPFVFALLPLVSPGSAAPPSNESKPLQWEPSYAGPMGGKLITDPSRLSVLSAMHAEAIEWINAGQVIPVERTTDLSQHNDESLHEHDKRVYQVFGLLGVQLLTTLGLKNLEKVLDALLGLFKSDDIVWESRERCRAFFSTHGGGNEILRTYAKDHGNPTAENKINAGWNNPSSTDPPVHFFEGDPAIGLYSVQFTATDTVAWGGIPNTQKCPIEGLCNPQYIFYRKGYRIAINTWESQGRVSACQYSGGQNCLGLCSSGVRDQFSTGGVVWGGSCAIPCIDDIPDDYVTIPNEEAKFMVVGDSISHGMEDDWTWRYRLSQWLDKNGYIHHFVGPWQGTHANAPIAVSQPTAPLLPGEEPPAPFPEGTGSYASGVPESFRNTGHAAWWGRQAAQSRHTIKAWVSEHQPDYLLILLGFNDLGWFVSGPEGLIGDMGNLVQAAREAKPDIRLLVGNVVHRSFIGGRQDLVDNTNRYNILLRDTLPNWFRWESPIAYVDVNTDYDCRPSGCPDGYDGLHPNARGEYHIAQAFARVLQRDFNYDGTEFSVPDAVDSRPVSTPGNVRSVSYPEGLFTTWDPVENARGYQIRARVQGATGWWSEGDVYPSTHGSWSPWVINGQTWEYQVRTKGDNDARSSWSALSSVTANIKTAPGPSNIIVEPQGTDVLVRWDAVTGYNVNRYGVLAWDKSTEGAFITIYPTKDTSLLVKGLKSGSRYGIWVATYVGMIGSLTRQYVVAGGLPAEGREFIAGSWAPAPPTGLRVTNIDATTVRLEWNAAAGASGYGIYTRSVRDNTALERGGTTTQTSHEIYFLFPGTWNFQFCISAYNGNLETAPVACVIPPVCCGFEKRDLVEANYTVVQNTSTTYNSASLVKDKELQNLFAAYQEAAELASSIPADPASAMLGTD
ncbi:Putative Fibronectin type III domain protein [Aspergillus calidoustus]|uniref:Putative Fibronectin type III domain protein n=1 Tax=Aspergillus calidoustus TaxID=454130 RepID=A0A0U5GPT5_ASPCI|nr:Putative Fibronectin type III domain protein [Aspergillus calidoustus]